MHKFKFTVILLLSAFLLKGQVNTFNNQLIYKADLTSQDFNAVQQTNDKGYIVCRSSVDTLYLPNNHYCEILKMDKTGKLVWAKKFHKGYITKNIKGTSSSINKTKDGNYIVATTTYDSLNNPQMCVLKIDNQGSIIWSAKYLTEGTGLIYCIKEVADNGFILCGSTTNLSTNNSYALAIKINAVGNLTWCTKNSVPNSTSAAFYSVAELPGQGYAFAGYSNNSAIIIKTDLTGALLWGKSFFTVSRNYISSIIFTTDHSLVITGWYQPASNAYSSFFISKLTTGGDFVWTKYLSAPPPYFGSYGADLKERGNHYYFIGYLSSPLPAQMLGKINALGEVVWCKYFYKSFHPFNYTPATMDTTRDGGFVFTTLAGTTLGIFSTAFVKTNADGSAGCDDNDYPMTLSTLTVAPLDNVISLASGLQANVTLTTTALAVRDSFICRNIQDSAVGIKTLNSGQKIKVYPNPAYNKLYVSTASAEFIKAEIEIINTLGQAVLKTSYNGCVDISGLQPGAYYLKVFNYTGELYCTKFMKIDR
jgi:hypothetical protein